MKNNDKLAACGLHVPELLMPAGNADLDKWAVVACDQFSSDMTYWKNVEKHVSGHPSTLNLILPECYLDESDVRVPEINNTMKEYLDSGVLDKAGNGFVYLDRSTPWAPSRKGLMVALDLEAYSYELGAECQIRPTEGTVLERLPVRAEIRKNAVLDLPHILVLLDDPQNMIFSWLEEHQQDFEALYDFDLADGAGHLKGSLISDGAQLDALAELFEKLNSNCDFLFAVGDGNHSLGAAKQLWNKIKEETGDLDHPARYALVELENIHDKGVRFEPIHRVLFDCDISAFKADFSAFAGTAIKDMDSYDSLTGEVEKIASKGGFAIGMIHKDEYSLLEMEDEKAFLSSEAFHGFLDPWMDKGKASEVEYIHGDDALKALSSEDGKLGFYLPSINKAKFFEFITKRGPMPRKTFSIGEAEEKRYYLESRKLIR